MLQQILFGVPAVGEDLLLTLGGLELSQITITQQQYLFTERAQD